MNRFQDGLIGAVAAVLVSVVMAAGAGVEHLAAVVGVELTCTGESTAEPGEDA